MELADMAEAVESGVGQEGPQAAYLAAAGQGAARAVAVTVEEARAAGGLVGAARVPETRVVELRVAGRAGAATAAGR